MHQYAAAVLCRGRCTRLYPQRSAYRNERASRQPAHILARRPRHYAAPRLLAFASARR
jgi:hypothetical protein